jgi:hypothetical protein
MKVRTHLGLPILALALTLAAGVPLMAEDAHTLRLDSTALLSGTQLAAGQYTIKWETHSPQATVSIWKGNKLVVTTDGKVVDRGKPYKSASVLYDTTSSGARVIEEIRFAGSSEVLTFGEGAGTSQAAQPQSSTSPSEPTGSTE